MLLMLAGTVTTSGPVNAAVKDQSRIAPPTGDPLNGKAPPGKPDRLLPENFKVDEPADKSYQPPNIDSQSEENRNSAPEELYDINDIPALEKLQLTLDIAKRALDAFAEVGTKYDDQGLNDYPTLKEFVDKTEPGKQLQKDVRKHGFADIVEWNTAIMNVSFAFGALLHDQKQDILHQVEAVKADKTIAADKKKRIIASLLALIPSKENIDIIRELQKLPAYQEKLHLLDAFE